MDAFLKAALDEIGCESINGDSWEQKQVEVSG